MLMGKNTVLLFSMFAAVPLFVCAGEPASKLNNEINIYLSLDSRMIDVLCKVAAEVARGNYDGFSGVDNKDVPNPDEKAFGARDMQRQEAERARQRAILTNIYAQQEQLALQTRLIRQEVQGRQSAARARPKNKCRPCIIL